MEKDFFGGRAVITLLGLLLLAYLSPADEWKPRHDLVSHTGVMNLPEPPSPSEVFFAGPASPAEQPTWLEGLKSVRSESRALLRYSRSQYDRPELEWTQHVFSQVQLLIWDRGLFDPERREYTVDHFLSETKGRIGPIDAVLIWHVYPNLGVDDRNQFELLRDLPGGIAGLRRMVEQFHQHGVKVFFPFLAWDTGTRAGDAPAWSEMTQLLKEIGADGINFDTLESVPADFRAASVAAGHRLAFEPQFEIRDESLSWSTLGWNDWVTWEDVVYPVTPMVSKTRWLEPRHMIDVTDRFTRDKNDSLQHAFFNGEGYATLENLWGFWYPMSPHDAEAVLRFTRIERTFAENLVSADWEPHAPTLQSGVFASKFSLSQRTLWTIVNRNEFDVDGRNSVFPTVRASVTTISGMAWSCVQPRMSSKPRSTSRWRVWVMERSLSPARMHPLPLSTICSRSWPTGRASHLTNFRARGRSSCKPSLISRPPNRSRPLLLA